MVKYAYRVLDAGYIEDIQNREDLQLVQDDSSLESLRKYLKGFENQIRVADKGFFVKVESGEFTEIYAYNGSVPDLGKPLLKLEIEPVLPGAPEWVKDRIMEAHISRLFNDLEKNLDKIGQDFDIERDQNSISLIHEFDGDYYELIEITLAVSDYGVIQYLIETKTYNENNELQYNDYFYCLESKISEKKLKQIENRELNRAYLYNTIKPTVLHAPFNRDISIENETLDRECYNNITHTHSYLGKKLTMITGDIEDINAFLQLREFFYSIGG